MNPKVSDVMAFLRPEGWVIQDEDFTSAIYFDGIEPITPEELEQGTKDYIAWKAQAEAQAEAKREAALSKLAALGLTADDLRALGL